MVRTTKVNNIVSIFFPLPNLALFQAECSVSKKLQQITICVNSHTYTREFVCGERSAERKLRLFFSREREREMGEEEVGLVRSENDWRGVSIFSLFLLCPFEFKCG